MKTAAFSAAELRFLGLDTPGPGFVGLLHARARRSPARGFQRLQTPLGVAPKPAAPLGVSHGEAGKPTAPPGLLHGEVRKPTTPPGLLHGEARKPTTTVAFARAGFFGRAAGRNGALPYNARKSQFLRNGDVWATESLFLFAVLWLAFLPGQSETGVAGGGKSSPPETPAAPRRPRPTTATGSRFLRRQRERPPRRPRPSPPAREGSLGAPNDRTFPPGAERKARKGKEKERRKPHAAPTPGLPTPGLARPLRLKMAGRAPSRNAPSVAESPQNQHRRSAS